MLSTSKFARSSYQRFVLRRPMYIIQKSLSDAAICFRSELSEFIGSFCSCSCSSSNTGKTGEITDHDVAHAHGDETRVVDLMKFNATSLIDEEKSKQ